VEEQQVWQIEDCVQAGERSEHLEKLQLELDGQRFQ
jgi:hypothetical protein